MTRFALIAFVVLLAGCSGDAGHEQAGEEAGPRSTTGSTPAAVQQETPPAVRPQTHPKGVLVDCSMRSEADFGPAFTDPGNLVVGPLLFVGGAELTSEATVLAHQGQKFPLLVKDGHVVTVQLPRDAREDAGLAYGPLPEGLVRLRDAHDTITFVSCRTGGPSGSSAGGPVTFWSGFVMTRVPGCVPLNVYVDGEPAPRHAAIPVGPRPCESPQERS